MIEETLECKRRLPLGRHLNHNLCSNTMKTKATFYHAGCPVCVDAETLIAGSLDRARYDLEVVHLGTARGRLSEAASLGVKSVPALVVEGRAYHINHGADLSALGA